MKIVIIGAGSVVFGREMLTDLFTAPELSVMASEIVLVDLDEARLRRMTRFAELLAAYTGAKHTVTWTTNRREALPGARYVITSVARQRYALWEQDYRIPMAFGFRHILGENGGPGALFHALRSLNLMVPIARDIEELAPEALLLNFTNPETRVVHAVAHLTGVRVYGLCAGWSGASDLIHRYHGVATSPVDHSSPEIEYLGAGVNHFYVTLRAVDRRTGRDLLPDSLDKARSIGPLRRDGGPGMPQPLFQKMAQVFDLFTFPEDGHIGEFLRWGAEYHDGRWEYGQEDRRPAEEPETEGDDADMLERLIATDETFATQPHLLHPSGELAVPIIVDRELDRGDRNLGAVNVLNDDGFIENLPRTAVVEVPATVDASGVHPVHVGVVPEVFAAMVRPQLAIHELITEAYRTNSRKIALQALLIDPVVDSIAGAERLLDTMLDLQRDYLPPLE